MTTYFSSASTLDPNVAQLQIGFQAFDGWRTAWINSTMAMGGLVAAVPLASPSAPAPVPVTVQASGAPLPAAATPASRFVSYPAGNSTAMAPGASETAPSASFNAQASNNLAVYYGQSPDTANTSLTQVCQDPTINIVILAFLTEFFGPGGQPALNFGPTCGDMTKEAAAQNLTGILDCTSATPPAVSLSTAIQTCQNSGKKVLLSLGGALSNTTFTSDAQATAFATTLWNMFGAGTGSQVGRPFGDVKIDGFDVGTFI